MYIPHTSATALLLIVVSMFCWGSWPNLLKALPDWRLEYFYLDYTFGFLLAMVAIAATAGSAGVIGPEFLQRLSDAHTAEIMFAFLGGLLWNIGNILLLNAIMVAGLAVAFPIASVLAITLGVGISYWELPLGNPVWMLAGTLVLVAAAWANARSYRDLGDVTGSPNRKGIGLSLAAGLLVGIFPPFVGRAISGTYALDPYSVCISFMVGASIATFIGIPVLLGKPLIGEPGRLGGYLKGTARWHAFGLLAGAIWCTGTVANFASAGLVGMAVSWGIGSGAPMVGALWGIFLWKEFAGAGSRARRLMTTSLVLYVAGVTLVAVAYGTR